MAGFLPTIAQKYNCGFIEIREPWKQYLIANEFQPQALLQDGIHVNDHGGFLLAELIKRPLVYRPDLGLGSSQSLARDYIVGEDVHWNGDTLELAFEGNRVDVIASTGAAERGAVRVLVDGQPPSQYPGCYAHTRPSGGHGTWGRTWGPGIMRVTFQQRPLIEDWNVRITDFDKQSKIFRFEIIGSKTGPDGAGVSNEDFVSESGRVVIKAHVKPEGVPEQTDWRMQGDIPVGYEIRWNTIGMFQDRYEPPVVADTSREQATTVAQGFANGKHTLTLRGQGNTAPAIRAIRIYRPPLLD